MVAEAAQIVLNTPVKKLMIPINVTHTAIVTDEIHRNLLQPFIKQCETTASKRPPPASALRYMLSTLVSYFAASYESTFGFTDGPPLHDALTIAYVIRPELFKCKRHRVDVELSGVHTAGETVVDVWNYRPCDDTWGPNGKNCLVAEELDVRHSTKLIVGNSTNHIIGQRIL